MKQFVYVLFAVLLFAQPIHAQDTLAPDPQIEQTIRSQLDAFEDDDFARAFDYAAPSIQGMFGTPEVFGLMVKRGYPMVWRPGEVRFTELLSAGSEMAQRVLIRDRDGQTHLLEYRLIDEGGQWRISGVRIIPQPGVAA